MNPARLLVLPLLLAATLRAQEPVPKPPAPVDAPEGVVEPAPQDKDKQPVEAQAASQPTVEQEVIVDTTKILETARDIALREQQYLARILSEGGLLHRFKVNRTENHQMSLKYAPEQVGPVVPKKQKARLLGDGEKAKLGEDVVFTVEGAPVTRAEYESRLTYLRSYPRPDGVIDVQSQAILSLARAKAPQAVFADTAKRAREELAAVAAALKDGQAAFADLAKLHSDDKQTGVAGGDRGFEVRDETDANYAQAAFGLNVGQVSDLIESPQGFHIIRVVGKKQGESMDKDRVRSSHILKAYTPDRDKLQALSKRIDNGEVDLAFRADDLRKFAPEQFQ